MSGRSLNVIPIVVAPKADGPEPDEVIESRREKVAFSVRDVAALLGLHRNTVYAQVKSGRIPVVYVGTKPLIPRRWIEETFGVVPPGFTPARRARSR